MSLVVVVIAAVLGVGAPGAGALWWRRQRRRAELALARRRIDETRAAIARIAEERRALLAQARRDVDDALRAERLALVEDLQSARRALRALAEGAPAEHPLTPGVALVARQLDGVVTALQDPTAG